MDLIFRLLFPLPGLFVLDVPPADLIEIHLAHVVEQGDDRGGLRACGEVIFPAHALPFKIGAQAVIYIERMPQQSSLKGIVVARACRGGEKIALVLEKIQQLVRAVPGDVFSVDINEFFLVSHNVLRDVCRMILEKCQL